jgi:hypothetical protein
MRYLITLAILLSLALAAPVATPAAAQTIPPAPQPALRILFAGNSLTYGRIHAEWPGGWGMAASAPDRDYVHRTQLLLAAATGRVPEIAVASLDLNRDEYFAEAQATAAAFGADIAVVQMGDQAWALPEAEYKTRLRMVARWFAPARLVITGSWYQTHCEQWNRDVAAELGATFVPLHDLYAPANWQYADCAVPGGVCGHPGDRGMALIAERVAQAVLETIQARVYIPQLGR